MLQRQNKGSHLNTTERFYIYAEYLNNNHLNDEHAIFPKIIFETLLKPHPPFKKTLTLTLQSYHTKYPIKDLPQND